MSKQNNNLEKIRHSASHVLAMAVLEMFPNAKLGIGPVIENGFYYDFDLPRTLTPADLVELEKKMAKIIAKNLVFKKKIISKGTALKLFSKQPYKLELIKELEEKPTIYETGDFVDLCKGPHIKNTREIKAFKLTHLAGAYWRGNERNPMLQRIYGTAFESQKALQKHLVMMAEAKKRDHRKIGKELGLFSFHEEGPGFPFWHPKGLAILEEIKKYWREVHTREGYREISTPLLLNKNLWEQSGHWKLYKDNMYITKIDNEDFGIKPMNCSGGALYYKERIHSYREFPLRIAELGLVHRHELSGVLTGLFRVRAFTQDDAHIYCTEDQVEDEIIEVIRLSKEVLGTFGFKDYVVTISVRDEAHKDKYLGDEKIWKKSEKVLAKALKKEKMEFRLDRGEAKFYGPSIDIKIKDSLGREWQCTTIQLDFNIPERFGLEYIGADGKKHTPIMIHRTILGSFERFIGVLLEHYGGALPLWLSPVQAKIIPVSDKKHLTYARKVAEDLKENGLRVEIDGEAESVNYKIRKAEKEKIPYMLVVGDREKKEKKVALRTREKGDLGPKTLKYFIGRAKKEIKEKK